MTSIMRRTVRGTAAGVGALAIIMGAAACGGLAGGGDEGEGETTTTEEEATEEETTEEEATEEEVTEEDAAEEESTEEGEDAAAGEGGDAAALTEEDLTAVGDAYFAFFQALGDNDGEAGCGLMLNPTTGGPYEGADQETCISTFEKMAETSGFDASTLDLLDRSMFEGVDNGDGTAGVSIAGTDAGVVLVKGDDGKWYIDTSKVAPAAG